MTALRAILRSLLAFLPLLALLSALAAPLWYGAAAFGAKLDFINWRFALEVMTHQFGPYLLYACLGLGAGGLLVLLLDRLFKAGGRAAWFSPVLAIAAGASGLVLDWRMEEIRAATPYLSDITTDAVDPPQFSAGLRARRDARHASLNYQAKTAPDGRTLAAVQAEAYPHVRTLVLEAPTGAVFDAAMELAHLSGWRVGSASRDSGMFEATAESFWFGFRDDVVVRIRESETGGSIVDLRSLARNDIHDMGRNARRSEAFLTQLPGRIQPAAVSAPGRGAETGAAEPDGAAS